MNEGMENLNNDAHVEDEHVEEIEHVDEKGMVHKFKSSADLMRFREEQNDRDNR